MGIGRRRERALGRYWNALAQGAPAWDLDPLADDLDPSVVAAVHRLAARDDAREPDPSFVARLEEDLMHASSVIPFRPTVVPSAPGPRDRSAPGPRDRSAARLARTALRRRAGSAVSLATAAVLVLALAGGLVAIRFGLPGSDDGHFAGIPAAQASPDATPSVSAVEFLWQTSGDPADSMENATNLAIAPDGSIWVPDGQNGRFQVFSPDGELLEIWGSPGAGPGEFDFTTAGFSGYGRGAIAFAPDGGFYVADTGNQRIQKFGPDRSFLVSWGGEGLGDGQFLGISDLAVDAAGRVFVVDANKAYAPGGAGADTVQVFDAAGKFLGSWGASDAASGALTSPMGIGVDPDGSVWIADYELNRLERFTPEGEPLGGWGTVGTLEQVWKEGQLFGPIDVAVDGQGNVYEVDYSTGRVQVFDRDGRFLVAWGGLGTDDGEFTGPVAVAVDGAGNAYVTDDAGRLQKFRVASLP